MRFEMSESNPIEDVARYHSQHSGDSLEPESGEPVKRNTLTTLSPDLVSDADAGVIDPKLCTFCQKIMNYCPEGGGYQKKLRFRHYDTTSALAESANHGCILCIHLIRSENSQVGPHGSDEDEDDYEYLHGSNDDGDDYEYLHENNDDEENKGTAILETAWSQYFAMLYSGEVDGGGRIFLSIARFGKLVVSIQMFPTFLPPTSHNLPRLQTTSTESSLPLCKIWLDQCLSLHEECRGSHGHRAPTRLLNIDDGNVRLKLSSELDTCPRYAALSHCWGSLPFLPLKKNNIDEFQHRVPIEALTKTFQDAIRITSYLDIEYLWIDSLCIIQDDIKDWNHKSPLMSDVYGGSTINIAASSAPDDSSGCFFDRHMSWGQFPQNQYQSRTVYYQCVPDDFEEYLLAQPLFKRAWVFQERLLSSRTLHFTEREIFWECEKKFACETFPAGKPSRVKDGLNHLSIRQINSGDGWSKLVNAYSGCNLTLSKDKLVAISGLARIVQEVQKQDYIAGLWREHLIS